MLNLPIEKIYNAYLIETNNYNDTVNQIYDFLINIGFDKQLILSKNHLDVYNIYEDNIIKVDDVRNKIIEVASIKPRIAEKKVFIIYNAKKMNTNAQNAFLKTLEEPESFNIFFLITDSIKSLLDTIKSRCICFYNNDENKEYENLYETEFYDFFIKLLCDLKYINIMNIDKIIEYIDEDINNVKFLIEFMYLVLNDVIIYKKTLDNKMLKLEKYSMQIITMANSFSYEFLGVFLNDLNKLKTDILNTINIKSSIKLSIINFIETEKNNLLTGGN